MQFTKEEQIQIIKSIKKAIELTISTDPGWCDGIIDEDDTMIEFCDAYCLSEHNFGESSSFTLIDFDSNIFRCNFYEYMFLAHLIAKDAKERDESVSTLLTNEAYCDMLCTNAKQNDYELRSRFSANTFDEFVEKYIEHALWEPSAQELVKNCLANILNNRKNTEILKDFIYKIDDSSKLKLQYDYDSVDEFFNAETDVNLYMTVIAVDTKETLFKLERSDKGCKYIVDLTTEDGENFSIKSFIKTKEDLTKLISNTIDALSNFPQFSKYISDLENIL